VRIDKKINIVQIIANDINIQITIIPHKSQTISPPPTSGRAVNYFDIVIILKTSQKMIVRTYLFCFHKENDVRFLSSNELLQSSNCPRVATPLAVP
jgi:hypothetical protein